MSCVALFTISSLLCGFCASLGWLVFFRVLQGAGGGGLQPSEQAILADTFTPAQRGMGFAVYGMAVVAAPALDQLWRLDYGQFYLALGFLYQCGPVGIISCCCLALISDPPT